MAAFSLEVTGEGVSVSHVISEGAITLGRSPDNQIVLDDRRVSRSHASFECLDSLLYVRDLGSSNGVTVNGNILEPRAPHALGDGDRVSIGPYVVAIRDLDRQGEATVVASAAVQAQAPADVTITSAAVAASSGSTDKRIRLDEKPSITIGRSPDCDVRLEDPMVSRYHARITASDHAYTLEDLDSSNGVYVDGRRIPPGKPQPINPGVTIWLGNTRFVLAGSQLTQEDDAKSVRLDAQRLERVTPKGARLLQNISLSILPQEFVVVVGPSGSGKSTLLGALSGLVPATSGRVLVNDNDLYENFNAMRTNIGYVPQDDIIHRELPVRASLDYAGELRLPGDTSTAERSDRVREVMTILGLSERAEVPVSSLSGGQRKRVSIGVELLTSPGLFFLDEATSGLDPATEAQLMRMLRSLSDDGQTILLVTHATKNVMMCDKVIFLARGGYLAYFGPPEEALTYFHVDDFDGIYERLENELTPAEWGNRFQQSDIYTRYITERQDGQASGGRRTPGVAASPVAQSGFFGQLSVLTRRYINIIRRDRVNLAMMLLIAPILASVDFIAWPRQILDPVEGDLRRTLTMLFLSSLIPFLVGALTSIREVVKEAPIHRRERAAGLSVMPYVISKTSVMGVVALYDASMFVAIKFIAVDFSHLELANYLWFYGTVFLAVLSGIMWGLLLSAIVPREDRAMHLVAALLVLQLVFSGGLLNLSRLGPPGTVLGSITSLNWALRAEASAVEINTKRCEGIGIETCDLPGIQGLETAPERLVIINAVNEDFSGIMNTSVYTAWTGEVAILLVLLASFAAIQKLKDKPT